MKDTIVVDLDGTLCNSAHRDSFAQTGQWEEFHCRLSDDECHIDVREVINVFSGCGFTIIAVTGRNEKYRHDTFAWLAKHDVAIDVLCMRPDDNRDPDTVIKPKLLIEQFESEAFAKDGVLFILDDRDKVVEAWRNLGFRCWQVQPGGY